ncbi:MAG TPA: hypothetical protein VH373_11985 [Jatrophihabitantaceae bacterium]
MLLIKKAGADLSSISRRALRDARISTVAFDDELAERALDA